MFLERPRPVQWWSNIIRIFGAIPSSLIRGSKLLLHLPAVFRFSDRRRFSFSKLRPCGEVKGEIPGGRPESFTREDKLARLFRLAVRRYLLELLQQSGT